MKIAILSHSTDHSGAPLASLCMAVAAKSLGHTVHFQCRTDGPLQHQLARFDIEFVRRVDTSYDVYLTSTIYTLREAFQLKELGKRVIPIIRESVGYARKNASQIFNDARFSLAGFDLCICISQTQRAEYQAAMPNARFFMLESCCPADVLEECAPLPLPPVFFVYSGYMNGAKGHERFARMLCEENYNEAAHIVFLGPSPDDIQKLNLGEDIQKKIIATGPVGPERAIAVTRECRGLVSLSDDETKGLAAMQALWFGKPVLLSQIPSFTTYDWSRSVSFVPGDLGRRGISITEFVRNSLTFKGQDQMQETQKICREIHSFHSFRARLDGILGYSQCLDVCP